MLKSLRLSILDKYIIKKFFKTIGVFLLVFIVISVSIDFSEKTDDFFSNQTLTAAQIITDYYLTFIPSIVALLLNIFVFISVIFFTSNLATKTEFIPMFGAGMSLARVLKPYFISSFIVSIILAIANLNLLPKVNEQKAKFLQEYIDGKNSSNYYHKYYVNINQKEFLGINEYNTSDNSGKDVSIYTLENNRITKILHAKIIIWDTAVKKWRLEKINEIYIYTQKEQFKTVETIHLNTFLKPMDFIKDQYLREKLSTQQLLQKISEEKIKGSDTINVLLIEFHKRFANPFSIIIFTLIGAIIAYRKIRGGKGLHLALGMGIAAVYVILDRFSTVFSTNAFFNPFIAAWIPNVMFLLITIWLYKKAPQ